jgi:hypothetical protein
MSFESGAPAAELPRPNTLRGRREEKLDRRLDDASARSLRALLRPPVPGPDGGASANGKPGGTRSDMGVMGGPWPSELGCRSERLDERESSLPYADVSGAASGAVDDDLRRRGARCERNELDKRLELFEWDGCMI